MSLRALFAVAAGLLLGAAEPARSEPDLGRSFEIAAVVVHPDHERPELFYYRPGALEIDRDREGRPSLHFLQLRYTGSALYGNEDEVGSFSTLSLGIRMAGPTSNELDFARRYVRRIAERARVELRPLPIAEAQVEVAYTPIDATGAPREEPRALPTGFFEADSDPSAHSSSAGFWRERSFTIPLGEHDSQLLWKTLHEGQVLMSVQYVFRSRGVVEGAGRELRTVTIVEEAGEAATADEAADDPEPPAEAADDALGAAPDAPAHRAVLRQVGGGVVPVRIDAARWPELFQRVDFDEQAPPGYAALRVYCYDFRDALRPDLFFKKVEIEAEAVGGRSVPLATKFTRTQPDLYARTIRFPVAVHVDRPYRYRVSAARRDGSLEVGPWRQRRSWTRILDITTPGDASLDDEPEAAP